MNGEPVCTEDCDGPCVVLIGGRTSREAECFAQNQYELEEKGTPVPQEWMDLFERNLRQANKKVKQIYDAALEDASPAVREALKLWHSVALIYSARTYGVEIPSELMLELGEALKPAYEFMLDANNKVAHRQPVS